MSERIRTDRRITLNLFEAKTVRFGNRAGNNHSLPMNMRESKGHPAFDYRTASAESRSGGAGEAAELGGKSGSLQAQHAGRLGFVSPGLA